MHYRRTFATTALIAVLVGLPLAADWPVTEKLDLDAIYRIKEEGLQRSKVMEIESYLTDVYGPRLTGSPNIREAADWAQKTLTDWGLVNVHLETWPFGRGWQNQLFLAMAMTPRLPCSGSITAFCFPVWEGMNSRVACRIPSRYWRTCSCSFACANSQINLWPGAW